VRPAPGRRVSTPLAWDEVPTCEAEAFTISTVPGTVRVDRRSGRGIDGAVGSLEALLELSRRHEAEGQGDAPWPPNYRKQEGEPPRVQPSRQRRADRGLRHARGRGGAREEPGGDGAAVRRRGSTRRPRKAAGDADPDRAHADRSAPLERAGHRDRRAKTKAEALEGLERWKARHPEAARRLEEPDVLVDGMRGRSSLWYRVRVNLTHVPEAERPEQEPLEVDYDPWAEYAFPIAPASSNERRRSRRSRRRPDLRGRLVPPEEEQDDRHVRVDREQHQRRTTSRRRLVRPPARDPATQNRPARMPDHDADHATPVRGPHDANAADDVEGAADQQEDPDERRGTLDESRRSLPARGPEGAEVELAHEVRARS
jgi:hypothetical protein